MSVNTTGFMSPNNDTRDKVHDIADLEFRRTAMHFIKNYGYGERVLLGIGP